jgi:zinc/manganese transport system permease protein
LSGVLHAIVEPGFFADNAVQVALAVGTAVALLCSAVGVFTVIRGQSFAAHAMSDVGATGGSGAVLVGVAPLWGFVAMTVAAATTMEAIGIDRRRGRDLATGIVLAAGFGLAALFLYWDSTTTSISGVTNEILFGEMFALSPGTLPAIIALGTVALAIVAGIYRPLLLSSVNGELAAARGVPARVIGALYLLALAAAVALSCLATGAILSTALLIGPAAAALRFTRRPWRAILAAAATALAACWLGVLLAYDSYYWPPYQHGWPVSFFIVALVFVFYLGARAGTGTLRRRRTV